MKTETLVAVVSTTTVAVEITQEELDLIIKKREKDAHRAKRNSYVDEMNDLLNRAKADGFTFAMNGPHSMSKAKPWNNAADNWIKVE